MEEKENEEARNSVSSEFLGVSGRKEKQRAEEEEKQERAESNRLETHREAHDGSCSPFLPRRPVQRVLGIFLPRWIFRCWIDQRSFERDPGGKGRKRTGGGGGVEAELEGVEGWREDGRFGRRRGFRHRKQVRTGSVLDPR